MSLCKGPETLWWVLLLCLPGPTQMPASRAVLLCFWLFFFFLLEFLVLFPQAMLHQCRLRILATHGPWSDLDSFFLFCFLLVWNDLEFLCSARASALVGLGVETHRCP